MSSAAQPTTPKVEIVEPVLHDLMADVYGAYRLDRMTPEEAQRFASIMYRLQRAANGCGEVHRILEADLHAVLDIEITDEETQRVAYTPLKPQQKLNLHGAFDLLFEVVQGSLDALQMIGTNTEGRS